MCTQPRLIFFAVILLATIVCASSTAVEESSECISEECIKVDHDPPDEVSLLQTNADVSHHKDHKVKSRRDEGVHGAAAQVNEFVVQMNEFAPFLEQLRVFMSMSFVLALAIVGLVFVANLDNHPSHPYLLGLVACFAFAVDNFTSTYAKSYIATPSAHIGMVFFMHGFIAILMHCFLLMNQVVVPSKESKEETMKSPHPVETASMLSARGLMLSARGALTIPSNYKAEWEETMSTSWKGFANCFLTAFFTVGGMMAGNIGFNMDAKDSGPHQAIICADLLVVAPVFYFLTGETLSRVQLAGCMLIIAGVMFMSDMFGSAEAESHRSRIELRAFGWLCVSSLSYAFSIITWRLLATGTTVKLAWRPRLLLIFGFMGLIGSMAFPVYLESGGFAAYFQSPLLLAWPILNTACSFVGMWGCNLAYQKAEASTGAIVAVVNVNSAVQLCMNALVLGMVPAVGQIAGMMVVVAGCCLLVSTDD